MEQTREEQLAGLCTEWRQMDYTWRECALYALAVGARAEDTLYTYEKNMKTLPTFGVLPYWGTVQVSPRLPRPTSVPVLVEETLRPEASYVNLEHEFFSYRPIAPIQGTLVYRDVLEALYDRGEGRGMAVQSRVDVCDLAGNLLCTNRCTTLFPTLGGYGGAPMPPRAGGVPDRDPDLTAEDRIGPVQNLLYRLTGDTNLVHVDGDVARARGLEGPFVHDLCAFGYACRMAIALLFPGAPEKLTRMKASMKTVLYPDTPIRLQVWKEEAGRAAFRLMNGKTGKPILDRGILEWRP